VVVLVPDGAGNPRPARGPGGAILRQISTIIK
jgi:hypothetical protein